MATFVHYDEVLCVQFLSQEEVILLSGVSTDPLPGHVLRSYTMKKKNVRSFTSVKIYIF